jgi:hypothetical protein
MLEDRVLGGYVRPGLKGICFIRVWGDMLEDRVLEGYVRRLGLEGIC